MITLYKVLSSYDKDVRHEATFLKHEAAVALKNQINTPGSMSEAWIVTETVYEDTADYAKHNPRAVRERAIAKLTEEERKVLGLRE